MGLTGDVSSTWDIGPALNAVRSGISERAFSLLEGIVSVVSKQVESEKLDVFPEWRDQEALGV